MANTTSPKRRVKKTPFKVPKGKTQLHLLICVDDEGETSYHEPSSLSTEDEAIRMAMMDHSNNTEGRVIDVHHIVIDLKPPKARKLAKKKATKTRKIRDGKAEAAKAEREKKAEEAKAAKKPSAKQETPSKKKAGKKRAGKKAAAPQSAAVESDDDPGDDDDGNE